jgi:hypothetical protein
MLDSLKQRAKRLLKIPDVQRAVSWANDTSRRVRANLSEARRVLSDTLAAQGQDDLETLKRELDEMTERSEQERNTPRDAQS